MSPRGLYWLRNFALLNFYSVQWLLRPYRFVQLLYHLATNHQESRLEKILLEARHRLAQERQGRVTLSVVSIQPALTQGHSETGLAEWPCAPIRQRPHRQRCCSRRQAGLCCVHLQHRGSAWKLQGEHVR